MKNTREENLFRKQSQRKCWTLSVSAPFQEGGKRATAQFSSILGVGVSISFLWDFFLLVFFKKLFFFSYAGLLPCIYLPPRSLKKPQVSIIRFFFVYFLLLLVWGCVVRVCVLVHWWGGGQRARAVRSTMAAKPSARLSCTSWAVNCPLLSEGNLVLFLKLWGASVAWIRERWDWMDHQTPSLTSVGIAIAAFYFHVLPFSQPRGEDDEKPLFRGRSYCPGLQRSAEDHTVSFASVVSFATSDLFFLLLTLLCEIDLDQFLFIWATVWPFSESRIYKIVVLI